MKKTSENERGIFLQCLKAQMVWALSGLILLVLFCSIAYSTADPDAIIFPLSLTALYLSSAIGGMAAAKLSDGKVAAGLVSGVVTALIVLALSAIPIYDSGHDLLISLALNALIVPAACVGAFVAKPRRKNPKKTRAKIKKMRR